MHFYLDILAEDFCDKNEKGRYVLPEKVEQPAEEEPMSPLKIIPGAEESDPMSQTNEKEESTKADEKKKYKTGRWTDAEHEKFLEALLIYGKDWDQIEAHIQTRDAAHARSHAQKFFMKLVKYLQGNEEIEEISNAEVYLEILKKKVEKPNRKKKANEGMEDAAIQEQVP